MLNHYSLRRLQTGQAHTGNLTELYFNDEIVEAWGKYVLGAAVPSDINGGKAVRMWNQQFVRSLLGYEAGVIPNVSRVTRHLRRNPRILESRAWVLPRVTGLHWTAILVDFEAHRVVYLDSCGGSVDSVVLRVCAILDVVSRELRGRPWDFTRWRMGSLRDRAPQQPDGHNCGVFPILLARCLHHGIQLTPGTWSADDLDEHRDLITAELVESRLKSSVQYVHH